MLFADSLEENWQVVVVVELINSHFPLNYILHAVGQGNGQVAAIVEATELAGGDIAGSSGVGEWVGDGFLWLLFVEAEVFASNTNSLTKFDGARKFCGSF